MTVPVDERAARRVRQRAWYDRNQARLAETRRIRRRNTQAARDQRRPSTDVAVECAIARGWDDDRIVTTLGVDAARVRAVWDRLNALGGTA